jgi:AcrR family transcriptional regulator
MNYRHKILEEAAVMFRIYGIRAVTMDMLASQMGISKRTIYEVFKDKDELLKGVLKWMTKKQRILIDKTLNESENVIEAIFKILDIMTEHLRNMSPAFRLDMKRFHNDLVKKLKETGEFPYYKENKEIIIHGINQGIFRENIDIEITDKCMQEVIRMTNDKDVLSADDFTNEKVVRDFYINYMRGISTQKGLDLINYYERQYKK